MDLLRAQTELRFFNSANSTRDGMRSEPVLMATVLTPGGPKILRWQSHALRSFGCFDTAILYMRQLCRVIDEPRGEDLTTGPPSTPANPPLSAWSALPTLMDDENSLEMDDVASTRSATANAELDEYLKQHGAASWSSPMEAWSANRARYPTL